MKLFILSVIVALMVIASTGNDSYANSAGSTSYEPMASGGSAGSTSYASEGRIGVVGRSRDRRMRRQGRRANRQDNRQSRRGSRQQAVGWNYTASHIASGGSAGSTSYAPTSGGSAGSTSYATSTYCVE